MFFAIDFYKDSNDKINAYEFLKTLKKSDKELWEQMSACLEKIKDSEFQKLPFSRSLGNGLHEARASYIRQQARVIYTFEKGKKIILLNGYIKNDAKSERIGISFGRNLLKEMKRRKNVE